MKEPILRLRQKFICDKCKRPINSPEKAFVEYVYSNGDTPGLDTGHKILHKGCEFYKFKPHSSVELSTFLVENGIVEIVNKMETNLYGVSDSEKVSVEEIKDNLNFTKRILEALHGKPKVLAEVE